QVEAERGGCRDREPEARDHGEPGRPADLLGVLRGAVALGLERTVRRRVERDRLLDRMLGQLVELRHARPIVALDRGPDLLAEPPITLRDQARDLPGLLGAGAAGDLALEVSGGPARGRRRLAVVLQVRV